MNATQNYQDALATTQGIQIGQRFNRQLAKGKSEVCYVKDIILSYSMKNGDFLPIAHIYAQKEINTFNTAPFEVAKATVKRGLIK